MLRNSLVSNLAEKSMFSLQLKWVKKYPWLIRTVYFDKSDSESAYVVSYGEKTREYILTKFEQSTGDIIWQNKIVNGGYGTPLVYENTVFCYNSFDSVIGYDSQSGQKKFNIDFSDRIRSSMNAFDNCVWFSHTSHLIGLTSEGRIVHDYHIPNAFLYGTISKYQDEILVVGTKYDQDTNTSNKYIWAISSIDGSILFEVNLGEGHIISTDTSGFWLKGDFLYISNNEFIFCISLDDGKIKWRKEVHGKAHRHLPVADNQNLYYTTLDGEIGALSLADGRTIWSLSTTEGIAMPPTICGDSLFVGAEDSVIAIDKHTGSVYEKIPIGHGPYSAVTISGNQAFVGAGEPPVNGMLLCFDIIKGVKVTPEIIQEFHSGNWVESHQMNVTIQTSGNWEQAVADPSKISPKSKIEGRKIGSNIFTFVIPLKDTNIESLYAFPIELIGENGMSKYVTVSFKMNRMTSLPSKVTLKQFNKDVNEVNPFASGAALTQLIEKEYGKDVNQEDFREIIDYLKTSSGWNDADFQTWRLLLKRALSSPAHNLQEFIEHEKQGLGKPRLDKEK